LLLRQIERVVVPAYINKCTTWARVLPGREATLLCPYDAKNQAAGNARMQEVCNHVPESCNPMPSSNLSKADVTKAFLIPTNAPQIPKHASARHLSSEQDVLQVDLDKLDVDISNVFTKRSNCNARSSNVITKRVSSIEGHKIRDRQKHINIDSRCSSPRDNAFPVKTE